MDIQYSRLLHTFQTAAIAIVIFAVYTLLPKLKYRSQLANLPVFGGSSKGEKLRQAYLTSAKHIYLEGYQKVGLNIRRC